MTLDGVTSFFRIINLRNTCKRIYYSQSSRRDLFSCNGGKLAFPSFLVYLPTSDLLPNVSLVVGQTSVNTSLALRAREISTSRLISNLRYIGQQITVSKNLFHVNREDVNFC